MRAERNSGGPVGERAGDRPVHGQNADVGPSRRKGGRTHERAGATAGSYNTLPRGQVRHNRQRGSLPGRGHRRGPIQDRQGDSGGRNMVRKHNRPSGVRRTGTEIGAEAPVRRKSAGRAHRLSWDPPQGQFQGRRRSRGNQVGAEELRNRGRGVGCIHTRATSRDWPLAGTVGATKHRAEGSSADRAGVVQGREGENDDTGPCLSGARSVRRLRETVSGGRTATAERGHALQSNAAVRSTRPGTSCAPTRSSDYRAGASSDAASVGGAPNR